MKISLTTTLISLFCFVLSAFPQKITEPELVGVWGRGEDFQEFIYHKTYELKYHLEENLNSKIVVRLCSKEKMPLAFVSSFGYAYAILENAEYAKISAAKIYFARYSKCPQKTEQYWFVPENTDIDYDEIILAQKVEVKYFKEGYHEDRDSAAAKKDFADNTNKFIEELKNNQKAKGFVICNKDTKNRYVGNTLRRLKTDKINKGQFQLVIKKVYGTLFPEFMTVTIKD